MHAQRAGLFLLWIASMGCAAPRSPGDPAAMQGVGTGGSVDLQPTHLGKRVRAVFRNGTQIVTGTVVEVDRERDTATVQADYGSTISFRPSQIAILEVFPGADEHAGHGDRETSPVTERLSLVPKRPDEGKILDEGRVQLLVVDWAARKHAAEACLVDLREPLEKAPSTVLWTDGLSTATLHVPIPEDPEAKMLPFAWHAHVLWGPPDGKKEERRDLFVGANSDGDILFELKELKDARQIILMGAPYRVEDKLNGIQAIAPPRMIAIDLEDAGKARAVLENNPTFVNRVETTTGRLYVASQSFNDSEVVLSTYDPEKASAAVMPQVRFSVQEGLLHPAWTLDVKDPSGKQWQRLGGYPVPPTLSFEVPDATRITLEVGMARLGEFSAPALPSVRTPEAALVRADLDVHYAGVPEGHPHRMLLGYGLPTDPDKSRLFSPVSAEVTAEKPREQRKVDTTKIVSTEDAYPCQAFVWYQMSTPWKKTGGFMAGATPMRAPEMKTAPSHRMAHYPAISPGVKFITFNGPRPGSTAAGIPLALAGNGLGGRTIGSGGPYVPFSPTISSRATVDRGVGGVGPSASASSTPVLNFILVTSASAKSGATAIAICNGGGGQGKCANAENGNSEDDGTKKRPGVSTPGKVKPPMHPTIDPLHPRPAEVPYLHGLISGWK